METVCVVIASFLAGFVDSIVGGGGLILIPAMLILYPVVPIPLLLGTNKVAALGGTGVATVSYARRVPIPYAAVIPAAIASFVFGFLGALAVQLIDPTILRPMVLVLLVVMLAYTIKKKDLGSTQLRTAHPRAQLWSVIIGGGIGFYDGFFGPGTGSFLLFLYVLLFGFEYLTATACAKFVNLSSNLSGAILFAAHGQVLWTLVTPMLVANLAGGMLGSRVAIKIGNRFVRIFFLLVVGTLILRLAYEHFQRL